MSASISGLGTQSQLNALDLGGQEPARKSVVEIRWYPPDHMHLVFRRQHCAAACGGLSVWNVGKMPGAHIAIQVPMTYEQEAALQSFIDSTEKERAMPLDTCAGNSAYILRKHTDLQIPRIVASFPACCASYLLFQKTLGNPQIGEVEFRGLWGDMGGSYNCMKSKLCLLVFPVLFLLETSVLLMLGRDCVNAIINKASLSNIDRLLPVQAASDLISRPLEYFAEGKAGILKDLDFNKTTELLFALFIMVSFCTALTSLAMGFLRK